MGLAKYMGTNEKRTPIYDNLGVIAIQCLGLIITESLYMMNFYIETHEFAVPLNVIKPALNATWILACLCLLQPYIFRNGKILLLCAPKGNLKADIEKKLREISILEGVIKIKSEKIWMLTGDLLAGSISLLIHNEANSQEITMKSQDIMNGIIQHLAIEIISEKEDVSKPIQISS